MNSATSTKGSSQDRRAALEGRRDAGAEAPAYVDGFRPWHFYIPLSMAGATVAVAVSQHTHPVALILLSAAVVAVGLVGVTLHRALAGFWGTADGEPIVVPVDRRDVLEREKALVLRSIKELEFDHKMRKVNDADFASIGGRLRARAITLMAAIEAAGGAASVTKAPASAIQPSTPADVSARSCERCDTANDLDATFCKRCGHRLGTAPS